MSDKQVTINFDGSPIKCDPSKSLLDNLIDNNIKATFSCKKGSCLTCMVRSDNPVPKKSQDPLKPTLVAQGYFLACQAEPSEGMEIYSIDQNKLFIKATLEEIKHLSGHVVQMFLSAKEEFNFRPGQFLNIKSPEGEVRSYSIASTSNKLSGSNHPKDLLELHVKKHTFGQVSGWLGNHMAVGDELLISGPNGSCFYIEGKPEQPILLIGTGTGLAPLLGIIRQALANGHSGPMHLYHGAVEEAGLYFTSELNKLAAKHPNLNVNFGVLKEASQQNIVQGLINEIALANHTDLKGWQVYLCGDPQMVQFSKQKAYLAGANMSDILSDPFELKDPAH